MQIIHGSFATGRFGSYNPDNRTVDRWTVREYEERRNPSSSITNQQFLDQCAPGIIASINIGKVLTNGSYNSPGYWGSTVVSNTGEPDLPSTVFVGLFPETKNGKSPVWPPKRDAMYIHPTKRSQLEVSFQKGYTVLERLGINKYSKNVGSGLGFDKVYDGNTVAYAGFVYNNPSLWIEYVAEKRLIDVDPRSVGFSLDTFLQDTKSDVLALQRDKGLITETLADADAGTLDILTSMAELPETVRSIYDGLKVIISMYRDARSKHLRLYNKAKSHKYQKTAHAAKAMKELNQAAADVWLNFRYNIMPTVYLIEDSLAYIAKDLSQFERWRGGKTTEFVHRYKPSGFDVDEDSRVVHRCFIKRLIDLTNAPSKASQLLLTNVFVTAWELVPLSFVIDWVLNIGNVLTSLSPAGDYKAQVSSYSHKINHQVTYVHNDTNARVNVVGKSYLLDIINPRDAVSVVWAPDINWRRQLDALALSWQLYLKNVRLFK